MNPKVDIHATSVDSFEKIEFSSGHRGLSGDEGLWTAMRRILSATKHKRWLILLTSALIVALCVFINRAQLMRAVIAYKIYHAQIFTPPPMSTESAWRRFTESVQFYWDFADFVMARNQRLKQFEPVLKPLVKEIARRQSSGEEMGYSMHIYREIRWLINSTANNKETQAKIAELRNSLTLPSTQQHLASEQQSSDGSWGLGLTSWYLRLYYSVDQVKECRVNPQYPLTFLDRINSPEKLTAVLDSDLMDNFTMTREFDEEKLNETSSALARILFALKPTGCYAFHPGLNIVFRDFIDRWQNPADGWWGQWLVDRQGKVWKMDDLSMTFHVISDTHGQVPHLDLIAKRMLQLDDANFPAGVRFEGQYNNHLNWDAVKIFRYAWPYLDTATRQQVRQEISKMLHWCLTESYRPDGSFKENALDDTPGDAYRYGVWFLQETGYFQPKERFWTDQDFPDAPAVHARIEAKLKATGLDDSGLREAYESLLAGKEE